MNDGLDSGTQLPFIKRAVSVSKTRGGRGFESVEQLYIVTHSLPSLQYLKCMAFYLFAFPVSGSLVAGR